MKRKIWLSGDQDNRNYIAIDAWVSEFDPGKPRAEITVASHSHIVDLPVGLKEVELLVEQLHALRLWFIGKETTGRAAAGLGGPFGDEKVPAPSTPAQGSTRPTKPRPPRRRAPRAKR